MESHDNAASSVFNDCNCGTCRLDRLQKQSSTKIKALERAYDQVVERNAELEAQIAQMYSDYKVFLDDYKRDLEKMVGLYTTIRVLSGLVEQK